MLLKKYGVIGGPSGSGSTIGSPDLVTSLFFGRLATPFHLTGGVKSVILFGARQGYLSIAANLTSLAGL